MNGYICIIAGTGILILSVVGLIAVQLGIKRKIRRLRNQVYHYEY